MSFLERHLPDPFYMEKDVRLSLREKIFREAVANLLVHREYLHQYPARIIIARDQVVFTNPCNPVFKGNIEVNNYYPHQKNPLISKFFLQLGWVEEIGTGIYNINKYLPFYSPGRKASFVEDVIFTTTIPIPKLNALQMQDMKKTTPHDAPHDTLHDTPHDNSLQVTKLLKILRGEMSREEILSKLELKDREHLRKVYLKPALESGLIELTLPDKLRSKKQKYRITEKGKIFLRSRTKQHE
jgi:ATP-dependent DNA helicase RecG